MLTLEHFLTREGLSDLFSVATYGNYWPDVGANVSRERSGGLTVEFGQKKWYFFISSRTIDL